MKRKREPRHFIDDGEWARIKAHLLWNNRPTGLFYRTIATRIYGANPSTAEVSRVGRVARAEGLGAVAYRSGESKGAKSLLSEIARELRKPKLKVA